MIQYTLQTTSLQDLLGRFGVWLEAVAQVRGRWGLPLDQVSLLFVFFVVTSLDHQGHDL